MLVTFILVCFRHYRENQFTRTLIGVQAN